ncbi:MAG: MFS transporter [Candidatus Dormiibacterota bacterium]
MSGAPPTTDLDARGSTWSPLRIGVFRALWLAVLVSNIGLWMQTVGAQWLLVQQPHASILVALVQTADMLPDVIFGVVGGALADMFDRRRLLIGVQAFMAVTGVALTVLTFSGQMPPALLLTFTFVLGSGSVISLPAYQSLIPDLVPRAQVAAASTLGSISINVARAIGPAIAGVLIARIGVGAVFAINAATFLVYGVVVAAWHPAVESSTQLPERFVSALRAGGRYVRYSPVMRRMLLRASLFLVPGSALWALLPLVATQRLQLGASGYGLLLAALGVGAVAGSFLLTQLRTRLSANRLLVGASLVYALVMAAIVLIPNIIVAVVALLPAGLAWIAVLSTMNASLQLFLPEWVRARGLSVYLTVLFGSQAVGAVLWGVVAAPKGVLPAYLIAAAMMIGGAATVRIWPLIDTAGMDRRTVALSAPQLAVEAAPDQGPVVVSMTYTVSSEHEAAFLKAMVRVRLSRLRTGASQWGLFRDGETAHEFVELFVVDSWDDHLRQHTDRLTGTDAEYLDYANSLSDPPPRTSHLIATGPPGE